VHSTFFWTGREGFGSRFSETPQLSLSLAIFKVQRYFHEASRSALEWVLGQADLFRVPLPP